MRTKRPSSLTPRLILALSGIALGIGATLPAFVSAAPPRRVDSPRTRPPANSPGSPSPPPVRGLGASQLTGSRAAPKAPAVDFDRDVRPILAENCFACHGFDAGKRQAGLRLDTPDGATTRLATGNVPVVAGHPESSALVRRVEGRTMPPASSGKQLSAAQIALLRRWVAEGGQYRPYWAFVPPQRPPLPKVKNAR